MRLRTWLIASLGLNLILAAAWFIAHELEDRFVPAPEPVVDFSHRVKTNTVVRRITISWNDLESTNLADYINNLRAIGCPQDTLRDLVLGKVNEDFAVRRATQIVTPDQQWWRTDADPAVAARADQQLAELEASRRALLNSLLGPHWETETDQAAWIRANYGLTGPHLGALPPETKRAVYDIAAQTSAQLRGAEPMDAARIRAAERTELAQVLPQTALLEYLLRYSQTAQQLREILRGIPLSADQFESLFLQVDRIALNPNFYYAGSDSDLRQQQRALRDQYDSYVRNTIGDEAFHALQLSQDPLYVAARQAVLLTGAPDKDLVPLYDINRATQAEINRINSDATLSDDDRLSSLASTRQEAEKAIEQLLGPAAFQRWLATQVQP